MEITRRRFLAAAALGIAPVPRVLLKAAETLEAAGGERVLVVIQLTGGNDGINTVIPCEEDAYYRSRPVLAVPRAQVLRLSAGAPQGLGLHPQMQGFRALFDEGRLAVVQGVGYANPSRSHFRSLEIWHSARPDLEDPREGWIGRAVSLPPRRLQAMGIGDQRLPLALEGELQVPSLENLDFLDFLAGARGRQMRALLRDLNTRRRSGTAEAARELALGTLEDLERLVSLREAPAASHYPATRLGKRLMWAGKMIAGGYPARIYYLTQDGYDTHSHQKEVHAALLGELSGAVEAFYRHIEKLGAAERVALFVFSEFGRRLRENGSLGTDHGCAAPVFVVSGSCESGLHGAHPSLTDLDEGDLKHGIDFRRLYATLLEDHLGTPSEPVLAGRFEKLGLFRRRRV
jgi:uncharacterized protein (DUF1501 family)